MAEVDNATRGRRPAAKRKKRRHGRRTLHYILITLFFLAAGVVLSLTVLFKIEYVTAVGADKYPPDEIAAESGIQKGENLLRVNSAEVRDRLLKKYPYIDTVAVKLKFPNEVQLEITQCVAEGALKSGDDYIMITRGGKVLERGLLFIPENVPLITGIKAGDAKPGDVLGDDTRETLRMIDYLYKALDETAFGEITNIDLTDTYNMKITYEHRLLLNLGTESELPAKLNFIKKMLEDSLPKDAEGLIDASDSGRSIIYTEMPIHDALNGVKRGTPKQESSAEEPEDKPGDDVDLNSTA